MANWCSNHVQFDGPEEQISKIQKVFAKMEEIDKRTHHASKFLLIEKNEDLDYMFGISFEEGDDYMSYETKWSPDPKQFQIIAQMFGVGFTYSAEELGMGIYCEYRYDPKENVLYEKALTSEEIASCNRCYAPQEHGDPCKEGEDCDQYENDFEEMDVLLSNKEWEVSQAQIPIL